MPEQPDIKPNAPEEQRQESVAPGQITDQPVDNLAHDSLGFGPYVQAVARFLTDESTKAPLTISIEGEWGSGKSSFMLMLDDQLKKNGMRTIQFNAWRHDKQDSLWAAFALQLNRRLAKGLPWYRKLGASLYLFKLRFRFAEGFFDLVRLLLLTVLLVSAGFIVFHLARTYGDAPVRTLIAAIANPDSDDATKAEGDSSLTEADKKHTIENVEWPARVAALAGALGLGVAFLMRFRQIFGDPFSINILQYARSPKYENQLSFIEQFHDDFAKVLKAYVCQGEKVYVFIDDLDRCEVPKAADLVQGLNLLVSEIEGFIFIIGMDREKVAAAIAIKFEKALPYLAPRLEREAGAELNVEGGLAFGYSFIEKFIQVPFRIPSPVNEMERFFLSLSSEASGSRVDPADNRNDEEARNRIALELKNDSPAVRAIGLSMAEAFDYNPRRLKQFLNLFRLQAFIASSTGLFGGNNPLTFEQLGKFVTIGLRWPLLMVDVEKKPEWLAELEQIALARSSDDPLRMHENSNLQVGQRLKEPFNRWTDVDDLERFFRVKTNDNIIPKRILPEWSFQTVDIRKLLRVSPPVKVTPASATSSQMPPDAPAARDPERPSTIPEASRKSPEEESAVPPSSPGSEAPSPQEAEWPPNAAA